MKAPLPLQAPESELRPIAGSGERSPAALMRAALWFAWSLGLTAFFVRIAAPNLANFRPVSSDEMSIMAVGYKVATHNVLGSDLYPGFFSAEQHYFFELPGQHILEGLSMRLFGVGVAQARAVSLVGGLSLIWVVGWLALRWY